MPRILIALCVSSVFLSAAAGAAEPRFRKLVLTDRYFCDGINTGDFNGDGKPDVVAGPFWYEGPAFKKKHAFYPPRAFPTPPSPTNSMLSYVWDFNGDGRDDILVLGRVHKHEAYWYENPGRTGDRRSEVRGRKSEVRGQRSEIRGRGELEYVGLPTSDVRLLATGQAGYWKKHFAFHRIKGESPPFTDVDGDKRPELVTHHKGRWGLLKPNWKEPRRPWEFQPITEKGDWKQFYHGTGIGDVNGDGRKDLILNDGWWEQPPKTSKDKTWTAHRFKFAKRGGAQMFAYDVDADGDNDIITALNAHGWGLAWFEHVKKGGRITFRKRTIMGDRSQEKRYGAAFTQPHALALADINGDGLKDIVVGKRRWAHGPKGDIEPNAAPVLYWFELVRQPPRLPPLRRGARGGCPCFGRIGSINSPASACR